MHLSTLLLALGGLAAAALVRADAVEDYISQAPEGTTWTADMFFPSADKSCVYSGPDGVFDQDSDAVAGGPDYRSCVCEDRVAGGASLVLCLSNARNTSYTLTCNGKGDDTDNKVGLCGWMGYHPTAPAQCYPKRRQEPKGSSTCMGRGPFPQAAQFEKMPCEYFANEVTSAKAGEKRFFCVGKNGGYKLQCPENILTKCAAGCNTKMESDTQKTQCGKAACKAPPPAEYPEGG